MGLDNAGKTSVITDIERALAGEVLPGEQPGQSRLRVDRFEVTLLELPGAQRSRSAWRSHYSEAHGLLFVLDSGDLARVEEARKVLSRVLSHPDASGKPLLLLANKQDTPAALLPCELIERLCLERLVNENRSPCRIVSAGPAPLPLPLPPPGAACSDPRPPSRRSPVSPSGSPPPARPAPPCRGCAGSSAPPPPPPPRRTPPRCRLPRGPPAAARPPAALVLTPLCSLPQGPGAPRGGCSGGRGEERGAPGGAPRLPPPAPGE
ncbi:ADP-ribosylation factor-like protein 13A [Serinus canaria]|uniref:ADP-ribosylation factor-like protein 13A n=1 Tax=Serinus canaria TaxID=9135 RepID=UPI0021CC84C1|nr:ADP-ribosylation factor-like protein 13A [Serinus canaria]